MSNKSVDKKELDFLMLKLKHHYEWKYVDYPECEVTQEQFKTRVDRGNGFFEACVMVNEFLKKKYNE